MTISAVRMTAVEFLAMPPDDVRNELVHGEVVLMPSPNVEHSYAITRLIAVLSPHIESRQLGELYADLDSYFGPEDVRRPDLLFFVNERLHVLTANKKPEAPPDLCIEVLSPSNAGYDRTDKFDLYQAAGVSSYWIVDPMERTVEGYTLRDGIYIRAGHGTGEDSISLPPFADLVIPLQRLWRPTPRPAK